MDTDLSNPAALAWFDTVDESALEATINPRAVFADVQWQGTLSNAPPAVVMEPTATVATSAGFSIDPKWLAVLAIAVLAVGALAVLNDATR